MSRYTIYTDGGCSPNPGRGGWAALIIDGTDGKKQPLSGSEPISTNQRMELTAVIKAVGSLVPVSECLDEQEIHLYTDSEYVRLGITEWKINNWKTSAKKPVANQISGKTWISLLKITTSSGIG